MLKNHISLMHGIKNPDFSQMAKPASQEVGKPTGQVITNTSFIYFIETFLQVLVCTTALPLSEAEKKSRGGPWSSRK